MIGDVAALFVNPRGPYPQRVTHWWDEARDARTYAGPWSRTPDEFLEVLLDMARSAGKTRGS